MTNLFPNEIRRAINSINNDVRQELLSYLINKGEATYSKLKDELDATKGNLNYHLNSLVEGGLLMNYVKSTKDDPAHNSYYRISNFGKSFINALFNSLTPKPYTESISIPRLEQSMELEATTTGKTQSISVPPPVFLSLSIEDIAQSQRQLQSIEEFFKLQTSFSLFDFSLQKYKKAIR